MGVAGRGSWAGFGEREGNLNSPHWRRLGLAGRTFALRVLALAFAALILGSQLHAARADEPVTVHIRGGSDESPSDQKGAANGDAQDAGMFEVGERDTPAAAPEALGEAIIGFALGYVGYPYVWAGNTPAGFDCAGFAQFVVLNTLGVDIGHAIEGQPGAGRWVDWGTWHPGDLVFFQNTYREGLSHVGIYIGDGLFVHAENEGTGVIVSSMYSNYYGPRYWGAVRAG